MPVMISLIWGDLATDRLLLTMWLNRHWVLTILIHHQFSRNLVTERGNTDILIIFIISDQVKFFIQTFHHLEKVLELEHTQRKWRMKSVQRFYRRPLWSPSNHQQKKIPKDWVQNWKIFLQYFFFNFRILERWRSWNRRGDPKEWTWRYNSNHLLCLNNDCTTDTYPTECRYLLEIE